MLSLRALTLSAVLSILAMACGDQIKRPRDFDAGQTSPCQVDTASVAGSWRITGSGNRTGCNDLSLDVTGFNLRADPLNILQDETNLSLRETIPGFALTGGLIQGRCLSFQTTEVTPLGDVRYQWEGMIQEFSRQILGDFTGQGPKTCRVSGEFRITVQ